MFRQRRDRLENKDLRGLDLKRTSPRLKILKLLEEAEPHHMSAEQIYQALITSGENVALPTIYRVLTRFEQAGLVRRHNFEGGYAVFEINQGEHHDHLVCIKCNRVEEFVDADIEERQEIVAKKAGFEMTDHSLTIYGVCEKCAI